MHAIPWSLDEATPCNAYCAEGWHVDITYDALARAHNFGSVEAHLLHVLTWSGLVEVRDIRAAPEAPPATTRYPDAGTARLLAAWGLPLDAWQAFRVTYRARPARRHC
jgi:hypothetical protein